MAMVDYLVMGFGLAACGGSLCGGVLIAFDSHAPEKLKAEDAEPIRNGESLMDPPCLHRISRPSHGAAHSSGGATRPSLTGSRPASAPIRTDRPEAQPTARMPPANHGDERKETRHVASAGHHPHPTRSRSYVSSPAELEDAVPPLDAPRDAERRRSFDGSESERASLMRDGDYNGCYPHGGPFESREGNYANYPGYPAHGVGMLARPHSHPNMHPRPHQCGSEGDEMQQHRYYQHHQHQQQAQQQRMYYQQQCHQYQQYLQQQQEQNREHQPQLQHQQQEQEQQQDHRRFHSNHYPHPLPLQKPPHSRSHTPPFPPSYQPPHAPDFPPHAPPRCPPSYPPSAFPNRPAGAPICPPAQRQQGGPGEQTAHRQLEQGLRTLPRLKV